MFGVGAIIKTVSIDDAIPLAIPTNINAVQIFELAIPTNINAVQILIPEVLNTDLNFNI